MIALSKGINGTHTSFSKLHMHSNHVVKKGLPVQPPSLRGPRVPAGKGGEFTVGVQGSVLSQLHTTHKGKACAQHVTMRNARPDPTRLPHRAESATISCKGPPLAVLPPASAGLSWDESAACSLEGQV